MGNPHYQAVIGMAAENFPGFGRKVFGSEHQHSHQAIAVDGRPFEVCDPLEIRATQLAFHVRSVPSFIDHPVP